MKLIPAQYQELETVYRAVLEKPSRCIALSSLIGGEGNTSVAMSIAKRLSHAQHSVLYLDLNRCHPIEEQKFQQAIAQQSDWGFSDISCQLSPVSIDDIDFLSVSLLRDSDLSREQAIVKEAITRLLQEYDYIVIDLSPVNRKNQANIPIQALSDSIDIFLLTVALGESQEADLLQAQQALKKAGVNQLQLVVCQHTLPPLGPLLLQSIETKFKRLPWLKNKLYKWVQSQQWLYYCH